MPVSSRDAAAPLPRPVVKALRTRPAPAPEPLPAPDVAVMRPRRPRADRRSGLVPRARLVAPLVANADVPVVAVVAPAGYGKTTLLEEWSRCDDRPFVWVRLRVGTPAHTQLAQPLERAVAGSRHPFVLAVDDGHLAAGEATRAALDATADALPPGSVLALASRGEPPLAIARLRAHRRVIEVRARDLAMTKGEAAALLTGAGVALDAEDVATLTRRTEGWPAGLYLAALSLRAQHDMHRAVARFGGDDRFVTDYLRDEVLSQFADEQIAFLTRTSPLARLSGPLCDAVLEQRGSGGRLRELARSNVLISALDRSDERFRYHPLLADMLRAELRRAEPDAEAEVHRRASAWHDARGDAVRAVEHATAAHDADRAGLLLWNLLPGHAGTGRAGVVERWLAAFGERETERSAPLSLAAAASRLAAGDHDAAERWTHAAEHSVPRSAPGERPALEAGIAVLWAALAHGGVTRMGRDAARASALEPPDSAWQPFCRLVEGVARHLTGDRDGARVRLEDGARRGAAADPGSQALCLAQLALLAFESGDDGQAAALAERARAQIERVGLGGSATSSLVHAASSLSRAARGRVDDAGRDAREAVELLAGADVPPWLEAEARIALARAQMRLGDVAAARVQLAGAARIQLADPEAIVLGEWIEDARMRADGFTVSLAGPSPLTAAELRVLGFLPSHLSLREIAGRLQVSANTVKTQAHSLYRKLDASSRSEAVARARHVGLLDG